MKLKNKTVQSPTEENQNATEGGDSGLKKKP